MAMSVLDSLVFGCLLACHQCVCAVARLFLFNNCFSMSWLRPGNKLDSGSYFWSRERLAEGWLVLVWHCYWRYKAPTSWLVCHANA